MIAVASLWRHPIKSHGREALHSVTLTAGEAFPWDRRWAVTHDATKHEGDGWSACRNFMIGTLTPRLAGLWARLDPEGPAVHLEHADLGEMQVAPDDPASVAAFLDWVAPLSADGSLKPTGLVSAGPRGMTDTRYPSVSIMNTASHTAVADALGGVLEPERWRGNIWLDGLAPWAEWDWIGQRIRIGGARLDVVERIQRCKHTMAHPVTGERDADTLGTLNGQFGHQDFGVYAVVIAGGPVALGDTAEVI